MINPQWLILPMSQTNFHGPKDVGATEVRLYSVKMPSSLLSKACKNMMDLYFF